MLFHHLHRDGFSLLKRILDKCIVLFEAENDSLGHVNELGYALLGALINVALAFDFLARFCAQEVIDAVAVDHVD